MAFKQQFKRRLNICVLGELGVGKSALSLQFTKSYFPTDFHPEVEDTYSKDIEIQNEQLLLSVLDTANQDDYSSIKELQLRQADGIIIVFNVNCHSTLEAVSGIFSHVQRVRPSLPPILLVGNKIDDENQRQVNVEEAENLAKELEFFKYIETSAKNNINVKESFVLLAEKILESDQSNDEIPQSEERSDSKGSQRKSQFIMSSNFEVLSPASTLSKQIGDLPDKNESTVVIEQKRQTQKSTAVQKKENSACCVIA